MTTVERLSSAHTPEQIVVLTHGADGHEWREAPQSAHITIVEGSWSRLVWWLIRNPLDVFEPVEPLWVRQWPKGFAMALAARLSARLRGGRVFVGTYAIENLEAPLGLDLSRVNPALTRIPGLSHLLRLTWGVSLLVLDGIIFGTPGAQANYETSWPSKISSLRRTLIPESIGRCSSCFGHEGGIVRPEADVLFVAEFSRRKGIDDLMEAWSRVRVARRDWRLRLFGFGELSSSVTGWAKELPEVEVVVGAGREEIHRALARASVVVLPSKRVSGWREQVGDPIMEGLAHGCHILATDDTGIASYLVENGHAVVPAASRLELAAALGRVLDSEPAPKVLPPEDRMDSKLLVHHHLCQWAADVGELTS